MDWSSGRIFWSCFHTFPAQMQASTHSNWVRPDPIGSDQIWRPDRNVPPSFGGVPTVSDQIRPDPIKLNFFALYIGMMFSMLSAHSNWKRLGPECTLQVGLWLVARGADRRFESSIWIVFGTKFQHPWAKLSCSDLLDPTNSRRGLTGSDRIWPNPTRSYWVWLKGKNWEGLLVLDYKQPLEIFQSLNAKSFCIL